MDEHQIKGRSPLYSYRDPNTGRWVNEVIHEWSTASRPTVAFDSYRDPATGRWMIVRPSNECCS